MQNVILLTVDCLRYDRCGFNGHHRNTTPNLENLASESLVFDRCYASGPYTTESLPGILAGQHSHNGYQYGDNTAYKTLPSDMPTIAKSFSDAGYQTAAVISNPHLTEQRNFDLGFDKFENFRSDSDDERDEDDDDGSRFGGKMYDIRERMRSSRTRYNPLALLYMAYRYKQLRSEWPTTDGKNLIERTIKTVDTLDDGGDPFFTWVHFMDVHAPISPRRAQKSGLGDVPTVRSLFWDASRAGRFSEPRYDYLYDTAIRYVDKQIGRLVDCLKQSGTWEETTLIVTSDHGEALFDRHSVYGHPPHYHFDELLRVPLIISGAGETGRSENLLSLAWLHEVLDQITTVDFDGYPSGSGTNNIFDEKPETVVSDTLRGGGHTVTLRDTTEKVIIHANNGDEVEWEYNERPVCYRYDTDQGERNAQPELPDKLYKKAKKLLSEDFTLPEVSGEFSTSTEQRLKDLGYKM